MIKITKRLELDRERLAERIADLKKQDPFSDPDRTIDNAASDQEASEESNHDRVAAMISELEAELLSVNAALRRIGEGTYGKCIRCHNAIDVDRLSIYPSAELCLPCSESKT